MFEIAIILAVFFIGIPVARHLVRFVRAWDRAMEIEMQSRRTERYLELKGLSK